MPVTIRRLTPLGIVPVDNHASSLAKAAQNEPSDGVYTVTTTRNTYDVLQLTAHLNRLNDSAERENIPLTLSHEQIRAALREVIDIAGYGDVKFRITVPRRTPDELILSVEPFGGYPATLYTDGVTVRTAPNSARHNPAAKDTAWMQNRTALTAQNDAYEIILMDADNHLLEGTTSNFYAILRDTLYTALDGVLAGTSRGIVFQIAPDVLPLVRRPVTLGDLPQFQEAFITSSSRGIVPVVQIDDTTLGDGTPGPHTLKLMTAYDAWVTSHLETL